MLLELGSLGYQIGALGVVIFTLVYLVAVRWWTDWLGLVLASVLFTTSGVLIVTTIRQIWPGTDHTIYVIRAVAFWAFGIAVWGSIATFIWSQWFAPRVRTTRRERQMEREET